MRGGMIKCKSTNIQQNVATWKKLDLISSFVWHITKETYFYSFLNFMFSFHHYPSCLVISSITVYMYRIVNLYFYGKPLLYSTIFMYFLQSVLVEVSNLSASLGHTGRRVVSGHTLCTQTLMKTDEQKKNGFKQICNFVLATFIAILGLMRPMG